VLVGIEQFQTLADAHQPQAAWNGACSVFLKIVCYSRELPGLLFTRRKVRTPDLMLVSSLTHATSLLALTPLYGVHAPKCLRVHLREFHGIEPRQKQYPPQPKGCVPRHTPRTGSGKDDIGKKGFHAAQATEILSAGKGKSPNGGESSLKGKNMV
jgi:hypothetical protein